MRLLARPERREARLQLTPMIDVTFQLLIFFLVAMRFRTPDGDLPAHLPEGGGPPVEQIWVTLRVSQDGPKAAPSVLLDGVGADGRALAGPMAWLEGRLRKLAADPRIRDEVPVVIEAQPHLAYQWVVHTLNVCRKLGFKQVHFAASKRNAPAPGAAPSR